LLAKAPEQLGAFLIAFRNTAINFKAIAAKNQLNQQPSERL
jgi:hypothetical protein